MPLYILYIILSEISTSSARFYLFIFKKERFRESRFLYEMKKLRFNIVKILKEYYNKSGAGRNFQFSEKETKKVIGKYHHQFAKRCRRV